MSVQFVLSLLVPGSLQSFELSIDFDYKVKTLISAFGPDPLKTIGLDDRFACRVTCQFFAICPKSNEFSCRTQTNHVLVHCFDETHLSEQKSSVSRA